MQRYFIKSDLLLDDIVLIKGEDVHHLMNVMRARVGERVIVCCEMKSYITEMIQLSKTEVHLRIVETKEEKVEMPVFVTIAQGVIKGDKFDWVVQKATECGADGFIPIAMKRSVAKLDATKGTKKVMRWQKIALEAARQSHRQKVPVVNAPINLKELIEMAAEYDVCMFAYEIQEADKRHHLAQIIEKLSFGMRVLILIGPEGGIDEEEARLLTEAGFEKVGLGPRILRTETAPIYVMSAISYGLEIERRF